MQLLRRFRTRPKADQPLPWPVAAFTAITFMSALAVGVTSTDTFSRLTMLGGLVACVAIWQTVRDPLVIASLMTMVFGAVLGWGLNFYDRIWRYDDPAHYLSSSVTAMALARLALPRLRADAAGRPRDILLLVRRQVLVRHRGEHQPAGEGRR